jgi:excisionase family DNA binding protein
MTGPRLPSKTALAVSGRRGGGQGEAAPHPVPPSSEPLLIDSREVARLLSIGRTKAFTMMAREELPVVRIGRSVRVSRRALEMWIACGVARTSASQIYSISGLDYASPRD